MIFNEFSVSVFLNICLFNISESVLSRPTEKGDATSGTGNDKAKLLFSITRRSWWSNIRFSTLLENKTFYKMDVELKA